MPPGYEDATGLGMLREPRVEHSGIMEKKVETNIVCRDYTGIMDKKMETPIAYRDYTGIMENQMETTIVYSFGLYGGNGKYNGSYYKA